MSTLEQGLSAHRILPKHTRKRSVKNPPVSNNLRNAPIMADLSISHSRKGSKPHRKHTTSSVLRPIKRHKLPTIQTTYQDTTLPPTQLNTCKSYSMHKDLEKLEMLTNRNLVARSELHVIQQRLQNLALLQGKPAEGRVVKTRGEVVCRTPDSGDVMKMRRPSFRLPPLEY